MRRNFSIISLFFILFILSASLVIAGQPVNVETAKRAAEYYGESVFEKDLKVCDYEVLHWAWGEQAVYVFTLMREGDFYPSSILLDNTLLQGAYLVSTGQEEAGYLMMAQADRYMTVYVGATTDMPSFIKAHAGLPEHIVIQPLMRDLPGDPYWIYGDLFHILLTSKSRFGAGDTKATEIHLKEIVDLKELGTEKVDAVPAYAEQIEWGQFIGPGAISPNAEDPSLANVKGVLEGWHQLTVEELNIQGEWRGCAPAAFYNCLKYLEKRGRVKTNGKTASFLLDWISICFNTDTTLPGKMKYGCKPEEQKIGATMVFKGCGYSSNVDIVWRDPKKALSFFTRFADEINSRYPCKLGGGTGIFTNHAVTGIGYYKNKTLLSFIVHDTSELTVKPVVVHYGGYRSGLAYPTNMVWFHPGGAGTFIVAKPKIEGPNTVRLDTARSLWVWTDKLTSTPKDVKVEAYGYKFIYYDANGVKYKTDSFPRIYPYKHELTRGGFKDPFKAGTVKETYWLIDGNGHLLVAQKTIRLVEGSGGGYTGLFGGALTGTYKLADFPWLYKTVISATVTITASGSGTSSDPYQGDCTIDGSTVETATIDGEKAGPFYNGIRGKVIVSGSAGQIVVAPARVYWVMLDKDGVMLGPFIVSFTGKIGVGGTLTGTITLDADPLMWTSDAPIIKAMVLTKAQ